MFNKLKIIAMTKEKEMVLRAKKLSKWFEIDLTIKIFGVVVFQWHYPPQENDVPFENSEGSDV